MPKLHANGIDIFYEVAGTGDPLMLISGLGYDSWMWHRMVPGLAAKAQVITFDSRGVGQTDKPAGPYSADMLAADTAGLLEGLRIEKATVLGHSMGGFVAQALALSRPDVIDKLILSGSHYGGPNHIPVTPEALAVLADTTGDPLERLKRGILVSCTPGFGEAHPEIVEEWLAYRVQNPIEPASYQAQMGVSLGLMDKGFEERLHTIQAPTMILFGEDDKVVPPGNADLLAKEIPNHTIEILPKAGHFYPFDATDAAVAAILAFLSS